MLFITHHSRKWLIMIFPTKIALFRVATLGTIGLITTIVQAQPAPFMRHLGGTRLELLAEGAVTAKPEIATLSAGVVTQSSSAAEAMRANAQAMAKTFVALRKAGVAERDIQTASLSLSPQYRYAENQPPMITGYQASNQVNVRFRDIAKAGAIIDALVASGANQINGPSFELADPAVALDQARREAIATARSRAELYAKAAGLRVKRIIVISEAGAAEPPRPVMAMAKAEASDASTALAPGEQRLAVTLNVSFELEKTAP
jgi:uncharacterized protein